MSIQTFGATFSPRAVAAASRVPSTGRQGSFNAADGRSIASSLPAYQSATRQRIEMGASQAGFDFDFAGRPGILPRAVHALNARSEPSNAGALVARRAGANAVMGGFFGVAGLGANPGCTSTGAQVAQGILAFAGPVLTSIAPAIGGGTSSTSRALSISGGATTAASAIYTGVCQAVTGTTSPTVSRAGDIGAALANITGAVAGATAGAAAATTPAAPVVAAAPVPAPAPEAGTDKTLLYAAGAAVAAVLVFFVVSK
jgi:hypothetical protein